MSRRILRWLVSIHLLAVWPVLLQAQAPNDKAAIEFSCLVWEALPIPAVFYLDGPRYQPLEFSPGNRSKLYPLKEAGALELFVKEVGSDGAESYKLVGQAPLVGGTRRMLFVIDAARQSTGLPLSIFGVDDALDTFPPGTFKFLNFSRLPLLVKFGGQSSRLPAGEIRVVKAKVPELGGFLPFVIGDAKGDSIFETRLFGQPNGREMVFIAPPAKAGGQPRVKFLTQITPPEPPKADAAP